MYRSKKILFVLIFIHATVQFRDYCLCSTVIPQLSGRRPTRRPRPASPSLLKQNKKYEWELEVCAASSLWEVRKERFKTTKKKKKKNLTQLQKTLTVSCSHISSAVVLAFWILIKRDATGMYPTNFFHPQTTTTTVSLYISTFLGFCSAAV